MGDDRVTLPSPSEDVEYSRTEEVTQGAAPQVQMDSSLLTLSAEEVTGIAPQVEMDSSPPTVELDSPTQRTDKVTKGVAQQVETDASLPPTDELDSPTQRTDEVSEGVAPQLEMDPSLPPTVELDPPTPTTPEEEENPSIAVPLLYSGPPSAELCTPPPFEDFSGVPLVDKSLMDLSTTTLPPCTFMDNKSDTNSAIIPICRICHMPEDENKEVLISPCRCAGTLQWIHNTCLMRWLEIITKKSRKPPKCELCHFQYHRHKKFKFHHWRFPRVSRQDKILHLIFIINLIIMIACAAATVMCFLSDKGQISKFPRNKVDLTTEEIITLSCGVLFFVSFFIAMSVQIKAKHTIYQLFVKFIMQNMEWEIDEYDKSKDSLYKDVFKGPSFV